MPLLELCLLGLLAVGLMLASWTVVKARSGRRALVVATLLFLSGSAFLAAIHQAEMLVYLGLAAGGFLAALLWEAPHKAGFSEERS